LSCRYNNTAHRELRPPSDHANNASQQQKWFFKSVDHRGISVPDIPATATGCYIVATPLRNNRGLEAPIIQMETGSHFNRSATTVSTSLNATAPCACARVQRGSVCKSVCVCGRHLAFIISRFTAIAVISAFQRRRLLRLRLLYHPGQSLYTKNRGDNRQKCLRRRVFGHYCFLRCLQRMKCFAAILLSCRYSRLPSSRYLPFFLQIEGLTCDREMLSSPYIITMAFYLLDKNCSLSLSFSLHTLLSPRFIDTRYFLLPPIVCRHLYRMVRHNQ